MDAEHVIAIIVIIATLMLIGRWRSLSAYPYAACRYCRGTGRRHIPHWRSIITITSPGAFRNCDECGGSPKRDRRMFGHPK